MSLKFSVQSSKRLMKIVTVTVNAQMPALALISRDLKSLINSAQNLTAA